MIIINFYDLLELLSLQLEYILNDNNIDWFFKFFIVLFNNRKCQRIAVKDHGIIT